jgi:hypothetical protein
MDAWGGVGCDGGAHVWMHDRNNYVRDIGGHSITCA